MRKIGLYGGTFDPIHHGHLILAREAAELLSLEKVIFIPAAISPFKAAPIAGGETRLSMVKVATQGEARFAVDDCELRRAPPSYAIDTAEDVRERESRPEIYYLIGEDNTGGLRHWHRFDELNKIVQFVVLERSGSQHDHPYLKVRRRLDISATDIRNRVALGQSIRYLVPAAVEEMIRQGNLYREQGK